jgi:Do/DeqQ family serine protease
MQTSKLALFLLKSVTIGLAAAFVVLFLRPDLLGTDSPIVEFTQSKEVKPDTVPPIGPSSYAGAVQIAAPAVVNVYTAKVVTRSAQNPFLNDPIMQRFFGNTQAPRRQLQNSLGSGVIVNEQGYILTNNHVVEGADEIQVAVSDGRTAQAKVVGSDRETDLAVLKIELDKLPSIVIGESDALLVGDVVLAIGNPFGVGQTVTLGIVSATGRNHLGINTFENFIQTDAAINPGNSGGALINAEGHLVGVNTAIFSQSGGSQGIGFAIPVSLAKGVMEQIIEHGRAIRGWLGVEVRVITPALAESFGLPEVKGVLITGMLRNGPADEAGLKPGDVITRINGDAVDDPVVLMNRVAQVAPGSGINLEGVRAGKKLSLSVEVGERPAQAAEKSVQ